MKLIILVTVLSCAVVGNAFEDEESQRMFGEWVMDEIARRTNTDMTLDSILSTSTQKRYYAVGAERQIELSLRMMARRDDGTPIQCDATIAVPEDIARTNLESYNCRDPDDGQFYKRSGETKCTDQEIKDIEKAAIKKINQNVDETNQMQDAGFDMLPMDMPGLDFTQGQFSLKKVESCTKVGNEIILKLDATQDNIDNVCIVKLLQEGNSYSVTKNQCQGQD